MDEMNQMYIIAAVLIISGPLILYSVLMHFSENKNGDSADRETEDIGSDLVQIEMNSFESRDYAGHTENVLILSKKFLEILGTFLKNKKILLFLKDTSGNFNAVLKRHGNINLSGEIIRESLQSDMIRYLEETDYLLSEDRKTSFISIMDSNQLSGIIKIHSEDEVLSSAIIGKTINECYRFGKLLRQTHIYEQTNIDPESGLMNGMKFQNDLLHEFRMKDHLNTRRQLILAGADRSSIVEAARILSGMLSDEFQLYRIASDTVAILGPEMDHMDYHTLKDCINKIDIPPECIYLGRSVLKKYTPSPSVWLREAEGDLKGSMNLPEADASAVLYKAK